MSYEEIKDLEAAYNAVFGENVETKTCERDARVNFISLMQKYTSKNIGDITTGTLEVDTIKSEYYRVIATG